MIIFNNQSKKKTLNTKLNPINRNRVLKDTKFYQAKIEMQGKKKIHQKIEGERVGNNHFFCERKLCKEWKSEWQIYIKMMIIKRNKIKEDKRKEEEWYQGGMFGGDEMVKRRRKVGESVNVKKK